MIYVRDVYIRILLNMSYSSIKELHVISGHSSMKKEEIASTNDRIACKQ